MCPKSKKSKLNDGKASSFILSSQSENRCFMKSAEQSEPSEAVLWWMMPLDYSQSRFGDRPTPSNACTFIALHIVDLQHRFDIRLPYLDSNNNWIIPLTRKEFYSQSELMQRGQFRCMPEEFVRLLMNGILNGNITHEKAMRVRRSRAEEDPTYELQEIFTSPDAISQIDKHYQSKIIEIDWVAVNGSFVRYFPGILRTAINSPHLDHLKCLYFVVVAEKRAISLVYERAADTIALFDSHSHYYFDEGKTCHTGSVVACVSTKHLRKLAIWMTDFIYPEFAAAKRQSFEVALLQVTGPPKSGDASGVTYPQAFKARIFREKSHRVAATNDDQLLDVEPKKQLSSAMKRRLSGNDYNCNIDLEESEEDVTDEQRWDANLVELDSTEQTEQTWSPLGLTRRILTAFKTLKRTDY